MYFLLYIYLAIWGFLWIGYSWSLFWEYGGGPEEMGLILITSVFFGIWPLVLIGMFLGQWRQKRKLNE